MIRIILQNELGSYVLQEGSWKDEITGLVVVDSQVIVELNAEVNEELPRGSYQTKRSTRLVVDKHDSL